MKFDVTLHNMTENIAAITIAINNANPNDNTNIPHYDYQQNCISIGSSAVATGTYCVSMGSGVAIGNSYGWTPKGDTIIGEINLTKLKCQVEKLEEQLQRAEQLIEKQNDMLLKLWYHPNMPGYDEASDNFNKHIGEL